MQQAIAIRLDKLDLCHVLLMIVKKRSPLRHTHTLGPHHHTTFSPFPPTLITHPYRPFYFLQEPCRRPSLPRPLSQTSSDSLPLMQRCVCRDAILSF